MLTADCSQASVLGAAVPRASTCTQMQQHRLWHEPEALPSLPEPARRTALPSACLEPGQASAGKPSSSFNTSHLHPSPRDQIFAKTYIALRLYSAIELLAATT